MWKLDPKIFLGVAGLPRLFNTQRHFLRVVSFHTWLAVCGEQYITSHYYRKYSGLSRNRSSFKTGLETRPNQFQVQDKLIQRPNMGEHPRFWITCCNMFFFVGSPGGPQLICSVWNQFGPTQRWIIHPHIYIFYLKVVCHQILFSEFGVGMINICIVLKLTPGSLVGVNPDFPPLRAKSGVWVFPNWSDCISIRKYSSIFFWIFLRRPDSPFRLQNSECFEGVPRAFHE